MKMNKSKKYLTIVALTLLSVSCSPDCKDDVSSYNSGYSAGHLVKSSGESHSCSSWANGMIDQGFNVDANDCYCAGFSDGKSGSENKYKK
jgi:PBP1b-binding outer membrane lipoprotein LpoB